MLAIPLLAILMAPASGTPVRLPPQRPAPVATTPKPLATSIKNAAATPATITFTGTNPDSTPSVAGSAAVAVTWRTTGSHSGAWNLQVSAPSTFSSCATVPAGAVAVTCGSVTGGSSGACGTPQPLSTTGTQIADGIEGNGAAATYTVNLTFTLQDSWKYIASSSCSLTVSYLITAN